MANFEPVLKKVLNVEGGWVDDKDDTGGETWQGVARNKNPLWSGWPIIDRIKVANPLAYQNAKAGKPSALNALLYANLALAKLVYNFYKVNYWDVNKLDLVQDQQLARNVADFGVNAGVGTGAITLQKAINKALPGALKVDGDIGPKTLNALSKVSAKVVYNFYNELRAQYYNAIIARKPSQVKFKKSWFSRIIPYIG